MFDRLVRADGFVGDSRGQNELPVRDRIPVNTRAVYRCEIGEPALERDEHVRLDQPFPERAHLLARQHREQVDALVLEAPHRARQQFGFVPRVGVGEQQQLSPGELVALHDRPLLSKPSRRQLGAAHQPHPVASGGFDDLGGAVGGPVVHDDHFDR